MEGDIVYARIGLEYGKGQGVVRKLFEPFIFGKLIIGHTGKDPFENCPPKYLLIF